MSESLGTLPNNPTETTVSAHMILHNGKVLTVDKDFAIAEAVASRHWQNWRRPSRLLRDGWPNWRLRWKRPAMSRLLSSWKAWGAITGLLKKS